MKHVIPVSLFCVFGLFVTDSGAETYSVNRTLQTDASSQEVWHLIGDFCDIDDWHPAITACDLKVIDGSLHRVLQLADGAEFLEKRVASESGLSYTYSIEASPLPIERYVGTLSVTPGDATTITWSTRFKSDDPEMEAFVGGIFDAGMAEIAKLLAQ